MLIRFSTQLLLALIIVITNTPLLAKPIPQQHQAFVQQLNQLILEANTHINQDRQHVLLWQQKTRLNYFDTKRVIRLAKHYRITQFNPSHSDDWTELLKRVDTIPASLALAQAINESAWGTSRFAQQGNNLYGTWCYRKGCGIIPLHANSQQHFEVKAYPNLQDSVQDYLLNLNSNPHYQALREVRYQLEQQEKPIMGYDLVNHLGGYSAIGQQYIAAIQSLITTYHLNELAQPAF